MTEHEAEFPPKPNASSTRGEGNDVLAEPDTTDEEFGAATPPLPEGASARQTDQVSDTEAELERAGRAEHAEPPGESASSPVSSQTALPYPTRYPLWLRVFLFLFVFDMVGRGLLGGIVDGDWTKKLSITTLPKGLPTTTEIERIRLGKASQHSVGERFSQTLRSVVGFYDPVPSTVTSAKLEAPSDWAKYTLTWLRTRMRFVGQLTMINHSWPMFSPNTRRARSVIRSRLYYADGTTRDHYPFNEPRSFTNYSRWFVKRPQKIDERLQTHYSTRMGMATYLSHEFPTSDSGAALQKLEMFKIGYRFPRIGDDVRKHWKRERARAQANQELIWRYDPKTGKGHTVSSPKKPSGAAK